MHSSDDAIELPVTRDAALWDRLVRESPAASMYQSSAWLDFQSELLGIGIERRLVVRDGRPVGVFPLARSGPRGLLSKELPFPFLGPLVPPDSLAGAVRALRRLQRAAPVLQAHFDLPPGATTPEAAAALTAAGAAVTEESTVVVELGHGSVDTLRAGYSKARRKNLRRCADDGVEVRPSEAGEFASLIGPLLAEAYRSHGRSSPYPDDLGARFEAWARGRADVHVLTALIGNTPVGALAVLGGFPTAIAWVGGALREYRDSFPNVALHDRMFTDAIAAGYERVDLSGWVDDAVGRYKLGYGGVRMPYLIAESLLLPQRAFAMARRVRRGVRARIDAAG